MKGQVYTKSSIALFALNLTTKIEATSMFSMYINNTVTITVFDVLRKGIGFSSDRRYWRWTTISLQDHFPPIVTNHSQKARIQPKRSHRHNIFSTSRTLKDHSMQMYYNIFVLVDLKTK